MNFLCFDILYLIALYLNKCKDILALRHCCRNTYHIYTISFTTTKYLPKIFRTIHLNLSNSIYDSTLRDDNVITFIARTTLPTFTNLVKLNCYNIKYNIDTEIVNMPYLNSLDLGLSRCILQSTLKTLTQLKYLSIGFNNFSGNTISSLTNLTYLNCGFSTFTNDSLKNLTKLTKLICGDSSFSYIPNTLTSLTCGKSVFNTLDTPNLTYLKCENNTDLNDLSIINLKHLKYLDCGYHTNITQYSIERLTNLVTLICGNKIFDSNTILQLPKLKTLICDYNDYDYIKLPNLKYLSYNGKFLGNNSLVHLTNLHNLKLGNYCNQFTDEYLNRLTNLTSLECGNCKFTDSGFTNLLKLRYLDCGSAYLTDKTLHKLHKLVSLICGTNCKFTNYGLINLHNIRFINCCIGAVFTNKAIVKCKHLEYMHLCMDTQLTYHAFIRKTQIITILYESDGYDSKFPKNIPNLVIKVV